MNLFGYTGAVSIAAAAAGATVCHVDSSKTAVQWCSENSRLSGIPQHAMRFMLMTVLNLSCENNDEEIATMLLFSIPQPRTWPSGEIWKLENRLEHLLNNVLQLLTPSPLFLLLNTYSAQFSTSVLKNLFKIFKTKRSFCQVITSLALRGTLDGKVLPCGITSRILWG